jgi:hypothetical protein
MGAKLTIIVLSILFFASSLRVIAPRLSSPKQLEIKTSPELGKAIVTVSDLFNKVSFRVDFVVLDSALAYVRPWRKLIKIGPVFADKSVKLYLLFRVLRN